MHRTTSQLLLPPAVDFSPALLRVLTEAACWQSGSTGVAVAAVAAAAGTEPPSPVELPEVLLALVDETECRAAALLAAGGVGRTEVLTRWPTLNASAPSTAVGARSWSAALNSALLAALQVVDHYPRPLMLATEHLLLGLLAAESEVGQWLAARGFALETLAARIHTHYGYQPGPLAAADAQQGVDVDVDVDTDDTHDVDHAVALDETADVDNLADFEGAVSSDFAARAPATESSIWHGQPASPRDVPSAMNTAGESVAVLRVLDAAANRAVEGLRVVEDYVRLVLDDRHLTFCCKSLRHDLHAALERVPISLRLAARETQADVGTDVTTPAEQFRGDVHQVAGASLGRLTQALRSLEEYGKLYSGELAARIEPLRYRAYTLQRAVHLVAQGTARLAGCPLCVLVDGRASLADFERLAAALVEAGVPMIQLRDKQLADRALLARARALRAITAQTGARMIVNDRPDLAVLSRADGVHVGQEELAVKDARAIVGPARLVGASTHSIEQARQAVLDGADYIGVGPTFPSRTKAFQVHPGTELLAAVAAEIRLPAFAIGGIDAANLDRVLSAGSTRIAVGAAVSAAADPAAAARDLLARLSAPGAQARES